MRRTSSTWSKRSARGNSRAIRIGLRQGDTPIAGVPEADEGVVDHVHRPPELARDGEALPQPEQDLSGNGLLHTDQGVVSHAAWRVHPSLGGLLPMEETSRLPDSTSSIFRLNHSSIQGRSIALFPSGSFRGMLALTAP